ncbi:MAG: hypothetical protein AAFP86_04815 [Planctomycetota bacterium]
MLFATPLLALSPLAPAQDLAAALPPEAVVALHMPSPRATLQLRGKNDLVSFALDARTLAAMRELFGGLGSLADGDGNGSNEEAARALVDDTVDFLGACDSLVAYFEAPEGSPGAGPPVGVLAARGGDALEGPLVRLVGSDVAAVSERGEIQLRVGEAGPFEAYARRGEVHVLATAPTVDAAVAHVDRFFTFLGSGEASGPFGLEGVRQERSRSSTTPALEFAVDLDQLWRRVDDVESMGALERWFFDGARSVQWAYGETSFGAGHAAETRVVAPYDEDSAVGGVLGFLRPVDLGALRVAPADAITAGALSVDLDGLARWLVEAVGARDETAGRQLSAGIATVRETTGIDLVDGLLAPLSDTMAYWESLPDPIEAENAEAFALGGPLSRYGMAFQLTDAEPYLDLMDTLEGLAGQATEVTTGSAPIPGTDGEIELWEADAGIFELTAGVAEDALLLVFGDMRAARTSARNLGTVDPSARFVARADVAQALRSLGVVRGGVSVQRTDSVVDVLVWAAKLFDGLADGGAEVDGLRRASVALEQLAIVAEPYVNGLTLATLTAEKGRLVLSASTR